MSMRFGLAKDMEFNFVSFETDLFSIVYSPPGTSELTNDQHGSNVVTGEDLNPVRLRSQLVRTRRVRTDR